MRRFRGGRQGSSRRGGAAPPSGAGTGNEIATFGTANDYQLVRAVDLVRGVAMFKKVAVPVLGIIENMSYFLCPHCGARSDIFAHGGARTEAEEYAVPFLGEVPLDIAIRKHSDSGHPLITADPDGEHARIFRAIAAKVKAALEKGRTRAAQKITIE